MSGFYLSQADIDGMFDTVAPTFDHLAHVSREIPGEEDRLGQPIPGSWSTHPDSPIACRVRPSRSIVIGEQSNGNLAYVIGRYEVMMPLDTDIKVADRIDSLTNRNGNAYDVEATTYEIKSINSQNFQLRVLVQAIYSS